MTPATSKPRILLTADVPGWAFDVNLRDLALYLDEEFEFSWWYANLDGRVPFPAEDSYDLCYLPYHRWPVILRGEVPLGKSCGGLRSRWFAPERPGAMTEEDRGYVRRLAGYHVVTRDNLADLDGEPNVVYLTNPVNVRRFAEAAPRRAELIAEWNGNPEHAASDGRDVKGLRSILSPAAELAQVPILLRHFRRRVPPSEMPAWYALANVALCASLYEGASNSTMEAMAAGLALVTTDCGNHRELQESQREHLGDSGIVIVERTPEAFADALRRLTPERAHAMGALNRREIAERWSWDVWAPRYRRWLRACLQRAHCRFWDTVDGATFLDDDRANPARAEAARIIAAEANGAGPLAVCEVAPGNGYCYRDHLAPLEQAGRIRYVAYEGSPNLARAFREAAPAADVRDGGFLDLPDAPAFDVLYCKAALEHQPDFRLGLLRMLRAARRMVLLNWYLPPGDQETRQYDGRGVWVVRPRAADVIGCAEAAGWSVERSRVAGSTNDLWVLRR